VRYIRKFIKPRRQGHERYLTELAGLIARPGPPDQAEITALRARHDIEQLTPLVPGRLR